MFVSSFQGFEVNKVFCIFNNSPLLSFIQSCTLLFFFLIKVVEVVNADALVIRTADGVQKKIHFSSLRPPR